MHTARFWGWASLVLCMTSQAHAQESVLDAKKAATRAAANDAKAAIEYGRALRRAGHDADALQELRRAAALAPSGALGIEARWELARTAITKHEFQQAMAHCRSVGKITGGAMAEYACAAEAHLLWRRGSEALTETEAALANGNKSYEAKVCE